MIPDKYPVPHIQNFTYRLHDCKIFTTFQLKKAFHQIPAALENRLKIVITSFGLFQFNRMTFGICGADVSASHGRSTSRNKLGILLY